MLNDDTSNLKAHLKALHANLAATGEVDEELQALLRQLDGDIRHLLERRTVVEPAVATQADADRIALRADTGEGGLAERTQELAARFAAEHPRMEPTLRELGRILANMGI